VWRISLLFLSRITARGDLEGSAKGKIDEASGELHWTLTPTLSLECGSSRDEAAALLARLAAAAIPVASFPANAPDLEEAYQHRSISCRQQMSA
jgi:hypothetical protein